MSEHRPAPEPSAGPVVDLASASFGYGERRVVSEVDLRVETGEVLALLGANGSGKSTLVKGLLGLCDHIGGRAELFGTPLESFTRRHLVGYVPQRHTLSAAVAATVEEIVAVGRLPHRGLLARPRREDRRIVADALELVGLADAARADVATLSGGQQRRVLIARALAARPEVLVMDEPTAGVDAASQRTLVDVLARLAGLGTTLVVVTHEIAPMRRILSRAAVMSAGRLVHDGPAAELDVPPGRPTPPAPAPSGVPGHSPHDGSHDGRDHGRGDRRDDAEVLRHDQPGCHHHEPDAYDPDRAPGPLGLGNVVDRPEERHVGPGGHRA